MFASRFDRLRSQDNMQMFYTQVDAEGNQPIQYRVYGRCWQEAVQISMEKFKRDYPDFPSYYCRVIDCPEEFECE